MAKEPETITIALEIGQKRAIASALEWPGWCRVGRDEAAALQALVDYGPRYARVLAGTSLGFRAPGAAAALAVVERLPGNATTDYGTPGAIAARDTEPVAPGDLERWTAIMRACWEAFDRAVEAAQGVTLRKGPRGGGRDLDKIVQHVREGSLGYLSSLGGTPSPEVKDQPELAPVREAILAGLAASVRGELPARGPRGGVRWPPRYFVRRLTWHELDHAWEIEDRAEE